MIVSEERRFVFIAVQKTASSSIERVLRNYGQWHNKQRHMPAAKAKKLIVPDWESYFSFAVIRHPVDWLHSWYKFWSSAGKDPESGVALHNRLPDISFAEFLSRTLENRDKHWKDIGTEAERVCDKAGGVLVSQLLCFDHLAVQFPKLLTDLGIPVAKLPEKNVSKLQQAVPQLPEGLMAEVRRAHHVDFLLYTRAYYDFAEECVAARKPVPPPKFDLLPQQMLTELRYIKREPAEAKNIFRVTERTETPKRKPRRLINSNDVGRGAYSDNININSDIEAARSKVLRSPENAKLHFRLGKLLYKGGNLVAAAESLSRAMLLNPSLVKSYSLLSSILLKQGDIERAVALSREAVAQRPNNPQLLKHLAKALRQQGQKDEAAAMLKRSGTRT